MTKDCKGRDSSKYIDAQAVSNDIVFEYATDLPDKVGMYSS